MHKYHAIEGYNVDSHGFDHQETVWEGAEHTELGFRHVVLKGEEALLAHLDAQEAKVLDEDAVATGDIAAPPAASPPVDPEKKKKDKRGQLIVGG